MLGSIISGLGSVVGGLFGASSAKKDRRQQLAYAQNGIQWRAADAKKAGIHPLYALGASTPTYTPVGSGGLAQGIANAGQAIGQGVDKASAKGNPLTTSQIAVNTAQKDLLVAQRETLLQNARNRAIGAVGVKNTLPNPTESPPIEFPWGNLNPAAGSDSQAIEDKYGGAIAEIVGGSRVLQGIINDIRAGKNTFVWTKKPKGVPERLWDSLKNSANSARRRYHKDQKK